MGQTENRQDRGGGCKFQDKKQKKKYMHTQVPQCNIIQYQTKTNVIALPTADVNNLGVFYKSISGSVRL